MRRNHDERTVVCFPFVGDSMGGSVISTTLVIRTLSENDDYRVLVVVHKLGIVSRWLDKQGIRYYDCDNIPYVTFKGGYASRLIELIQVRTKVSQFLRQNKIDILHTNDGRMHATWALGIIGISTNHIWHQRSEFPTSRLLNLLILCASKVIVISEYVKRTLPNSASSRAVMIPNPIDPIARVPHKPNAKKIVFGWSEERANTTLVIGFVGALNNQKRIMDFIAIVADSKKYFSAPIQFLIIGKESEYTYEQIRTILQEKKIADCCRLEEYKSEIATWYEAIDILIAPSENEAFGRNIIEGIERGAIIVAARSGGHAEILDSKLTGRLVDVGDIVGYLKAIDSLLENFTEIEKTADVGRSMIVERYNTKTICNQIVSEYRSLATSPIRHLN